MKRRRLRTGEIPEDIMEEILQGIGMLFSKKLDHRRH